MRNAFSVMAEKKLIGEMLLQNKLFVMAAGIMTMCHQFKLVLLVKIRIDHLLLAKIQS